MRLIQINPPSFSGAGTLTSGSASVSAVTVNPMELVQAPTPFVGQPIAGSGIPAGTTIAAVGAGTLTLSQQATAAGSATLWFGAEPVTLAEAKLQARVEFDDDDALIWALVTAARKYAEARLRSALITQTWTLMLDSFPSAGGYYNRAIREIWPSLGGLPSGLGFYPGLIPNSTGVIDLPLPPLQSVASVNYYDFAGNFNTVSPSTYNVSLQFSPRIQPQYSLVWPISRPTIDSVQITFTSGYGNFPSNVPVNVKHAMLMHVAHLYENREAVMQGGFVAIPLAVDALLSASDPGIYS